jgi:pyrimidine-nucleoside phosphorylase/thymidine phosphorylase
MTPREVIEKKRDGGTLTKEEIAYFIRGYMSSEIADYHMSALLMAILLRGFNSDETLALTREMRDSGKTLDLSSLSGKKIDKHSTGGVGDKTSLLVTPIAAACGLKVPMITGRGLGHTGGTLDKLESIPGFNSQPDPETILAILAEVGAVIMGQTDTLAPADRRMYALRDVTATVESIPLITSSMISKKLAEGIDGLVMNVNIGSGAFLPSPKQGAALARSIADVCRASNLKVVVVITDMEQPLGRAIGNALEVRECIEFLNGRVAEDLETVSLALAAQMLLLGGCVRTWPAASKLAYETVSAGKAGEHLRRIIAAQGGDDGVVNDPDLLPKSKHVRQFTSARSGFVASCDAKLLGLASNALGAGRNRVDDVINHAVGLYLNRKIGDRVERGEPLCEIHWDDEQRLLDALPFVEQAYEIKERPPYRRPLVHAVLGRT